MTPVKTWVAVATLVAVIVGAFATGGALARIARLKDAPPDGVRMDQAADLNSPIGTGETPAAADGTPAPAEGTPPPTEGTPPAAASEFGADYGVAPDGGVTGGVTGGAEGDLAPGGGNEGRFFRGEGEREEGEDEHFGGRFGGRRGEGEREEGEDEHFGGRFGGRRDD